MPRILFIILLLCIFFTGAIARQEDYARMLTGTWKLDSAIDKTKTKSRLRLQPGYQIQFEKTGSFSIIYADQQDTAAVKPLANFLSATWQLPGQDSLLIDAVYTFTQAYIKKSGTSAKTMSTSSRYKIIYLDESFLRMQGRPDPLDEKISVVYYSRVK